MTNLYTPLPFPQTKESARAFFKNNGICINSWTKHMQLKQSVVTNVLYGSSKGNMGASHEAAVALGLKAKSLSKSSKLGGAIDLPPKLTITNQEIRIEGSRLYIMLEIDHE